MGTFLRKVHQHSRCASIVQMLSAVVRSYCALSIYISLQDVHSLLALCLKCKTPLVICGVQFSLKNWIWQGKKTQAEKKSPNSFLVSLPGKSKIHRTETQNHGKSNKDQDSHSPLDQE